MREVVAKRITEMTPRSASHRRPPICNRQLRTTNQTDKLTRLESPQTLRPFDVLLWGRRVIFVLWDGKQIGTKRAGSFHKESNWPRNRDVAQF
jgi:hypothetical protein